jgi:hypothetical protein
MNFRERIINYLYLYIMFIFIYIITVYLSRLLGIEQLLTISNIFLSILDYISIIHKKVLEINLAQIDALVDQISGYISGKSKEIPIVVNKDFQDEETKFHIIIVCIVIPVIIHIIIPLIFF